MSGFFEALGRTRVRLRLVVSLPLFVLLSGTAAMIAMFFTIGRFETEQAQNFQLVLARNLVANAQHDAAGGADLFGALGNQVGSHDRMISRDGVHFILMRTSPAGPYLIFDPASLVTPADQTQLLTLTADVATPRILPIGLDRERYLASAHAVGRPGYFLVALESWQSVQAPAWALLRLGAVVALLVTIGIGAAAWVITAPLHRLAERTLELARRELVDPAEVARIVERSRSPEETASLALALEEALNALVHLKRSIHGIIESIESGVLATDPAGRIQFFNSAARRILGPEGDLIGRPVHDLIPSPGENRAFLNLLAELFEEGVAYGRTREIPFRNGRGETLQLGVSTALVPDEEGRVLNHLVVFVDLTDIADLKERLRRADRLSALGSMATRVAHEIRNPLGSIKGLAQLVLEIKPDQAPIGEYMGRIVREVDRLSGIVDELLDYSQRRPLSLEWVDLNDLVHEGLEMSRFRTGARGPAFLQELEPELPRVRLDRNRFLQAVLNVVINAIQAVGSDGVVTVSTFMEKLPQGRRLVLEVADNGPGISPEALDHIFDPFYTTKENGSGLGLSIAHSVVREHEGVIQVESKIGQGTTFRILIPQSRWEGGEVE
jgi:PAS domain S-box-containing protein